MVLFLSWVNEDLRVDIDELENGVICELFVIESNWLSVLNDEESWVALDLVLLSKTALGVSDQAELKGFLYTRHKITNSQILTSNE